MIKKYINRILKKYCIIVAESKLLANFIFILVILNCFLFVFENDSNKNYDNFKNSGKKLQYIFTIFYLLEIILKIIGELFIILNFILNI